jgi:L-alanine-DL-glutamate epimerase-like enolase superfamily enzyme
MRYLVPALQDMGAMLKGRRRENPKNDLAALNAVRRAVGDGVRLMVDFNQGLSLAEALHRCHAIDDHDLEWMEDTVSLRIPGRFKVPEPSPRMPSPN